MADRTMIEGTEPLFRQENHGGFYYVYSKYTLDHSEIFGNILLPTAFNNANHARNGFISFGITDPGELGIDAGIKNDGQGWYPCAMDVRASSDKRFREWPDYRAPATATNAKIVLKPVNNSTVHLYVQWLDKNGNVVYASGKTAPYDMDIDIVTRPELVDRRGSSGFYCRFYRFASLVPYGTDDRGDGSYMRGGKFMNLGLYNQSTKKYDACGLTNKSLIEIAWIEHPGNCTVTNRTSNGESFSINHNT